jgi:TolB protein
MKRTYALPILILLATAVPFLTAQDPTITGTIVGRDSTRIAVPDFKGKGATAALMARFNEVVWEDLADSGVLDLVAKTNYPLDVPQSPSDLRPPTMVNGQPQRQGMWLTDWSNPPVNTNYLAIGAADVNGTSLVLRGALLNAGLADIRTATVFEKPYFGSLDEAGARKVAHEYAGDILRQMGAISLAGSKIYFTSNRTGSQEIWSMDYNGQNQQQITRHRSISKQPAISNDGRLLAYTTMVSGASAGWQLRVVDAETGRPRTFSNATASTMGNPEFSPDGKRLWYSMTINESPMQIVTSAVEGGARERISRVGAIEISPRVNPRNPSEVLFISGRNGRPQLYRMNADGSAIAMITTGDGEVANPAWSPDGRKVAFAWTRGYDPGNFNIFVMDVSTRQFVQLTRQNGSNENPFWAPDGVHLVFSNERGGRKQIYSMLANGQRLKQLTTQGDNVQPVWAKPVQ